MAVEIRRAGIEDLDLLMDWRVEVLQEVFDLPEGGVPPELVEANRRYYREELATGGHVACFALLDGQLVGCGGVCIQREMPSPDNQSGINGYLMNIYTRTCWRGRGVGRAVVEWLVGQAHELGAGKVYLETTADGRPLYQAVGFADLPDIMKLEARP